MSRKPLKINPLENRLEERKEQLRMFCEDPKSDSLKKFGIKGVGLVHEARADGTEFLHTMLYVYDDNNNLKYKIRYKSEPRKRKGVVLNAVSDIDKKKILSLIPSLSIIIPDEKNNFSAMRKDDFEGQNRALDDIEAIIEQRQGLAKKDQKKDNLVQTYSVALGDIGKASGINQDKASVYLINSEIRDKEDYLKKAVREMTDRASKEYHEVSEQNKKKEPKERIEPIYESGSTFCAAIVGQKSVTVANLGDSRAFLVMKNDRGEQTILSLTEDFEPELTRFGGNAGRKKLSDGKGGSLAVAGAIGDRSYIGKGLITEPDIATYDLENLATRFKGGAALAGFKACGVLLASDGFVKKDVKGAWAPKNQNIKVYDIKSLDKKMSKPELVEVKRSRGELSGDINAKSFIDYLREDGKNEIRDDNTVSYVDLKAVEEGKSEYLMVVADGHGDQGHVVSSHIMEHFALTKLSCLCNKRDLYVEKIKVLEEGLGAIKARSSKKIPAAEERDDEIRQRLAKNQREQEVIEEGRRQRAAAEKMARITEIDRQRDAKMKAALEEQEKQELETALRLSMETRIAEIDANLAAAKAGKVPASSPSDPAASAAAYTSRKI